MRSMMPREALREMGWWHVRRFQFPFRGGFSKAAPLRKQRHLAVLVHLPVSPRFHSFGSIGISRRTTSPCRSSCKHSPRLPRFGSSGTWPCWSTRPFLQGFTASVASASRAGPPALAGLHVSTNRGCPVSGAAAPVLAVLHASIHLDCHVSVAVAPGRVDPSVSVRQVCSASARIGTRSQSAA